MSDETEKSTRIERIRVEMARGLSALKVMIDERTTRIDRVERKAEQNSESVADLRVKLATIEERLNNVREDVTGKHDLVPLTLEAAKAKGKEEIRKETREQVTERMRLRVERWKANSAIIAAVGALIAGLINLFLHFTGGGH